MSRWDAQIEQWREKAWKKGLDDAINGRPAVFNAAEQHGYEIVELIHEAYMRGYSQVLKISELIEKVSGSGEKV